MKKLLHKRIGVLLFGVLLSAAAVKVIAATCQSTDNVWQREMDTGCYGSPACTKVSISPHSIECDIYSATTDCTQGGGAATKTTTVSTCTYGLYCTVPSTTTTSSTVAYVALVVAHAGPVCSN